MLLEAESVSPLFYENATEAYLAGCAVLNENPGKYRRQNCLHGTNHPGQPAEMQLSSLRESQPLGIFRGFLLSPCEVTLQGSCSAQALRLLP